MLPRDQDEMGSLHVPVRTSAVSLGAIGLVVGAGSPWHPSLFERMVDHVVRGFGLWTVLHVSAAVAVILALVGRAVRTVAGALSAVLFGAAQMGVPPAERWGGWGRLMWHSTGVPEPIAA